MVRPARASFLPRLLIFCIACIALLPLSAARAGSYSGPQYSGGTWYGPGPNGFGDNPYHPFDGGWGGGSGGFNQANCGGQITATFTWNPTAGQTDPPPQSVIVTETSTTSASGASYPPGAVSGSCADGFGHSQSLTQSPIKDGSGNVIGTSGSVSLSNVRYRVVSGGMTVQVQCTPTASASAGTTATASVSYSATLSPVTIDLQGVTPDPDDNNALKVLTGQQITTTLNGLPSGSTNITYQWAAGGDTFKTYDTTAPNATYSTQLVPLSNADETQANFSFYDKKAEALTVTCTATFTAPDGVTSLSASASKPLAVLKPTLAWTVSRSFNGILPGFYNDPYTAKFGARELWGPMTITEPALFTGDGSPNSSGTGCIIQIATPTRSHTRVPQNGKPATYDRIEILLPYPYNVQDAMVSPMGVDAGFPYPFGYYENLDGTFTTVNGDFAWIAQNDGYSADITGHYYTNHDQDGGGDDWNAAFALDSFDTWVMYRPPSVGGQGTVYVPLQTLSWTWGGNASLNQLGFWDVYETPAFTSGTPSNTDTPPDWYLTIPLHPNIGP